MTYVSYGLSFYFCVRKCMLINVGFEALHGEVSNIQISCCGQLRGQPFLDCYIVINL